MVLCKKLTYQLTPSESPSVLLGIMEQEDEHFFYFRTKKNLHKVSKKCVLYISETQIPFKNGEEE